MKTQSPQVSDSKYTILFNVKWKSISGGGLGQCFDGLGSDVRDAGIDELSF